MTPAVQPGSNDYSCIDCNFCDQVYTTFLPEGALKMTDLKITDLKNEGPNSGKKQDMKMQDLKKTDQII